MSYKNTYGRQNGCGCGCDNDVDADVNAAGIAEDCAAEAAETSERRREDFSDPICVSAKKIYDSCRERNCVADSRVYFTAENQQLIEDAINVKLKKAEIIWVYTDIEPLLYNSGYYSIDIKFFIDVTLEVFTGLGAPEEIHGLTTYDKRIILYGSEGRTKTFTSTMQPGDEIERVRKSTNMPTVTVEAVDPIALGAKLVDKENCCGCCNAAAIPENICSCYGDDLVVDDDARQVQVSFGLFTIARIERDVSLMIDAVDFCVPEKVCAAAGDDDPCDLFNTIRFPLDEFFPPAGDNTSGNPYCEGNGCGCGCN